MPRPKTLKSLRAATAAKTRKAQKPVKKINRRRAASGFEKAIHALLKQEKIPFVTEKTIGRMHVDILIGEKQAVELNGCYWHGHTLCQKELSPMQMEAHAKDARRYAMLRRLGYEVYLLWECDFEKHPEIATHLLHKISQKES